MGPAASSIRFNGSKNEHRWVKRIRITLPPLFTVFVLWKSLPVKWMTVPRIVVQQRIHWAVTKQRVFSMSKVTSKRDEERKKSRIFFICRNLSNTTSAFGYAWSIPIAFGQSSVVNRIERYDELERQIRHQWTTGTAWYLRRGKTKWEPKASLRSRLRPFLERKERRDPPKFSEQLSDVTVFEGNAIRSMTICSCGKEMFE